MQGLSSARRLTLKGAVIPTKVGILMLSLLRRMQRLSSAHRRGGSFFSLDGKETNLSAAKACLPLKNNK